MREDVARAVCDLARVLQAGGTTSMEALFLGTGFLEDPSVDASLLERELRRRPELVDSWVRYAQDQRTSSGWYLLEPDAADGPWLVGHLTSSGIHVEQRRFADGLAACACFIKSQADELRARCQGGRRIGPPPA